MLVINIPIDRKLRARLLAFRDQDLKMDITTLIATLFYYHQIFLERGPMNRLCMLVSEYMYSQHGPVDEIDHDSMIEAENYADHIVEEVVEIYHDYAKTIFDKYLSEVDYWDLTLVCLKVTPTCITLTCRKQHSLSSNDMNNSVI